MFTINRTFNVIDTAFSAAEVIERFDAVAVGEKVINISATVAAIVIGVCSYVWTALLLWWEDNNATVITHLTRFTFLFIDALGATYYAGVNTRPVINYWVARVADTVLYNLAEVL
jgi:hypothetical protein